MIKTRFRKIGIIPIRQYFFGYHTEKVSFWEKIFGIIMIIQNKEKLNLKGWKESDYDTAITDLTKDKDEIFKSFSSTKRNEINRAEREGITHRIKDIQKETISNFLLFYNRFATLKKLRKLHASDLKKFKKDNIIISTATYHNEDIVYHVYVQDGRKIRLLHSCSLFRNIEDKQFRNIVGYANNGLHYFDIIMAKKEGFEEYDRGGIYLGEGETPDGRSKTAIAKFKLGFNPTIKKQFNYIKYGTFIKKLLDILGKEY